MPFQPQVKHTHYPHCRFLGVFTSGSFLQDSTCSATDTAKLLFLACTGFEFQNHCLSLLWPSPLIQVEGTSYMYVGWLVFLGLHFTILPLHRLILHQCLQHEVSTLQALSMKILNQYVSQKPKYHVRATQIRPRTIVAKRLSMRLMINCAGAAGASRALV